MNSCRGNDALKSMPNEYEFTRCTDCSGVVPAAVGVGERLQDRYLDNGLGVVAGNSETS